MYWQFIGIDVSKKTLDITILDSQGKQIYYERIANESKSIKSCFSSFMKQYKAIYKESVFCMEYTGIYNLPLVKWLKNQSANIWMESGSQINKSQGLVRGKNDKVDSLRIANYAFTNRHISCQMLWWDMCHQTWGHFLSDMGTSPIRLS